MSAIAVTTTRDGSLNPGQGEPGSATGEWIVARVAQPAGFDDAILGGYACSCNGRTLFQLNRTMNIDSRVQIGAVCSRDNNRSYLRFGRMPWKVEEYTLQDRLWSCDSCGDVIGTLRTLDGVIVGVALDCPLCQRHHRIGLTLGALPEEIRLTAFGIAPPVPLLSPPAYDVLQQIWERLHLWPSNEFVYQPSGDNGAAGRIQQVSTGASVNASSDHLSQLLAARLINDTNEFSLTRSGGQFCRREFGGNEF